MTLIELPISDLRASDVGSRVVVTQDGVAFDGILSDLSVSRSDYNFDDTDKWPKISASIKVKTLTPGVGTANDEIHATISISKIPMDYRIQVDSGIRVSWSSDAPLEIGDSVDLNGKTYLVQLVIDEGDDEYAVTRP